MAGVCHPLGDDVISSVKSPSLQHPHPHASHFDICTVSLLTRTASALPCRTAELRFQNALVVSGPPFALRLLEPSPLGR